MKKAWEIRSENAKKRHKKMIGLKIGHWFLKKPIYTQGRPAFLCQCQCGKKSIVRLSALEDGSTKSCGCMQLFYLSKSKTTHGLSTSRFYYIWKSSRDRVLKKHNKDYPRYGGKGLKYSKRWLKFENFRDDMYEEYKKHCLEYGENNTSIDRINNNKGYFKSNCRWATRSVQAKNRKLRPRNEKGQFI